MLRKKSKPGVIRRLLTLILGVFLVYLGVVFLDLFLYRFVSPPITGVQLQRLVEAPWATSPMSRTTASYRSHRSALTFSTR
ncbi:hypothetical protein N9903_01985 [bacterium]|nr:hypothetical protein [bacterium]